MNIELNFPPKLRGARSRLYRRRFLQVNTRWKALAEIYTMHSFAPFSNLEWFVKICKRKFANFARMLLIFRQIDEFSPKCSRNFARSSSQNNNYSPKFSGIQNPEASGTHPDASGIGTSSAEICIWPIHPLF